MNSFFKNLSPANRNTALTGIFYLCYFLVCFLFFWLFPGGPSCGPGVNAIPMLLLPFVVGILTVVNLVRLCLNRDHLGSVLIHSVVLLALVILVNL
ncbi:hypothetical protein [Flavobacterium sp.]|uniref:hypothetical protein n=1 Tax=Flavobacterium sp. TaxID=239 RepID=UPI0039E6FE7F